MKIKVLFVAEQDAVDADLAPAAISAISEYDYETYPDGFDNQVSLAHANKAYPVVRVVDIEVDEKALRGLDV